MPASERGEPHAVEWAASAARALQRLPEKVAAAAVELIYGALAENPHRVGRPLRFELEGRHSARRGDYRVVYRIDDESRVIVIEAIAHRADVYRRRAVNHLVRRGLATPDQRPLVRLETFRLGLRLDISNVAEALEIAEGPDRH